MTGPSRLEGWNMSNPTPDTKDLRAFFVHRSAASDHGLTRDYVSRREERRARSAAAALGVVVPLAVSVGFAAVSRALSVASGHVGRARVADLGCTLALDGAYDGRDGALAVDGGFLVMHVGGGAYDEAAGSFSEPPLVLGVFEVADSGDGTAFRFVVRRWTYREFLQPAQVSWKCKKFKVRDVALSIELECPGAEAGGYRASFDRLFSAVSEEGLSDLFGPGEGSAWLPAPPRPGHLSDPRERRRRRGKARGGGGKARGGGGGGRSGGVRDGVRARPVPQYASSAVLDVQTAERREEPARVAGQGGPVPAEVEARQGTEETGGRDLVQIEASAEGEEAVEASVVGFSVAEASNESGVGGLNVGMTDPERIRGGGGEGVRSEPPLALASVLEIPSREDEEEEGNDEGEPIPAGRHFYVPTNVRISLIESTRPYVLAQLLQESANATEKIAVPLTNLVKAKLTRK